MAARRRKIESLIKPYRITDGKGFRLKQIDPRDTQGLQKEKAQALLQQGIRCKQKPWIMRLLYQPGSSRKAIVLSAAEPTII